jgi:hypothetical protein
VVEHSHPLLLVKGSRPATTSGTGREKMFNKIPTWNSKHE